MKIVNKDFRPKIFFENVLSGTVFKVPGRETVFMKMEEIVQTSEIKFNCVSLETGDVFYMEHGDIVIPLKVELIIEGRL